MSDPFAGYGSDGDEGGSVVPAPLRDPVGVLKRRWRLGAVAFLLLAVPSVLLSRMVPPEYEAASRLLLTSKAIPDEFVPDTIRANAAEQFQAVENRVISRSRIGKLVASDAFAEEREQHTAAEITGRLLNAILVEKKANSDGRGGIGSIDIRVSLRGEDPNRITYVVNTLVDDMLNEYLAYRNEQSQVPLDFMRREYERADEALRQHQRELAVFRETNRGSLPEEQTATMSKLERLESQRRSTILELNSARSQLAAASRARGGTIGGPSPRESLEAELERLRALYTDEHPEVRALQRRIESLDATPTRREGGTTSSGARDRLEAEIREREGRLAQINEEVSFLETQVARTSSITEEYRALERKEAVLQEAYDEYLRKLKSAELSRSMELAQQGDQLVRLEAALPPTSPVISPLIFTAAALVVSIGLSVAIALLFEFLSPVIVDEDHLEKISSFPTLGSIPPVR